VRLLQRILQRAAEVILGHLQVVFGGHGLRVPDPGTDDVQRELSGQFRFPRAPEVLVQFRLGRQASPLDDTAQLRAQVLVAAPVARDDVLGPRLVFSVSDFGTKLSVR